MSSIKLFIFVHIFVCLFVLLTDGLFIQFKTRTLSSTSILILNSNIKSLLFTAIIPNIVRHSSLLLPLSISPPLPWD